MKDETQRASAEETPPPVIRVAPSPHLAGSPRSTRGMMIDVLIGLFPLAATAVYVFHWYAVFQLAICTASCLLAEAAFTRWRGRSLSLGDCSAAVTGIILALALPWNAPWYVGGVASVVAISIGKIVFGGVGQNIFNPAMTGRAFVMICFPVALGATAYQVAGGPDVVAQATPLTLAKQVGTATDIWSLFLGTVNGSLGETSAIACIIGGLYLCFRRTASWEIPLSILLTVGVLAGIGNIARPQAEWTVLHHLFGGALLFGVFFIATDPVSSPLTPGGKWIFGVGIGALVMLIRVFSGYPEGVMFAVLLMNALVPLINRWTIPRPLGGPVPTRM